MHILEHPVRIVAVAVCAAAALASSATAAAPDPPGCKAPNAWKAAKYADEVAATYVTYCEVCFDIGYKAIRKDYKLSATTPKKIAIIYVRRDEFGYNRTAGTQGCRRGFALRKTP